MEYQEFECGMASAIANEPESVRQELATLVAGDQRPGSFGDLVKQSLAISEQHEKLDGVKVVSLLKRKFDSPRNA